jgi:hypothetical protein
MRLSNAGVAQAPGMAVKPVSKWRGASPWMGVDELTVERRRGPTARQLLGPSAGLPATFNHGLRTRNRPS